MNEGVETLVQVELLYAFSNTARRAAVVSVDTHVLRRTSVDDVEDDVGPAGVR
jgi:hypothetical protein